MKARKRSGRTRRLLAAALMLAGSLAANAVSADTPPGKTDAMEQLHRSFYNAEKEKDAKRIEALEDVPAMDWLEMSMTERLDQIAASMGFLSRHGVPMRKSMNDYYNAVSEKLRISTNLYASMITDLLADILYEKEPASRDALDRYRKEKK